jgi:protoheme IX farnesyltransferase
MRISDTTELTHSSTIAVLRDYFELTKPKISALVLVSMGIGYALGSGGNFSWLTLLHASIGTLLIAGGTSAYNMFIERDLDGLMKRTSQRPLPTKRITPTAAFVFSTFLIFAGLSYLILQVNLTAALISASTTVLYLWAYTPMKRISYHNVFIGAIPGALPPVGGWAAATGTVTDWGMWFLFIIVFLWQIPHVMAIAWMYGDDYSKAGFNMLPVNDLAGLKTSRISFYVILLLLPTVLGLYLIGTTSWIYLLGALPSTAFYVYHGWKFKQDRSRNQARRLMFASLAYLPLIWIFVLVDRILLG